jgi:Tfp pilus assembly protein PilV
MVNNARSPSLPTVSLSEIDMQPRGSILLEALLAIGLASMFMLALTTLVLIANTSSDRASELQTALWSAAEGVEAMQTVSFASLPLTSTGKLTLSGSTWAVGTDGPQTLPDGSSRILRILSVSRDGSCNVVTSGGTVDSDSKYIESEVTWTDSNGHPHTITDRALRTNWESPTGTCFGTTQAGQVTFQFSTAQFSGGKQLRNIS